MKKGFTLVELLAVIVIIALIAVIAVPTILGVINKARKGAMDDDAKLILDTINREMNINPDFKPTDVTKGTIESMLHIKGDNYASIVVTMVDGKPKLVITGQDKWDGLTAYGTNDNLKVVDTDDYDVTPPVIALLGSSPMDIEQGDIYTDAGATATDAHDGNITDDIVKTGAVDTNTAGTYSITYTATDQNGNTSTITRTVVVLSDFDETKGVNRPKLATGMTPIKWNGSAWVDTTKDDTDWYYYDTNKQWANARTADGSMWVWIPRYAYQVATYYHASTAVGGTMNVKFLRNKSSIAGDNSAVDTTATYVGSSQTNYMVHPAFKFGNADLAGIWVAKFEPSVSNHSDLCYTSPSIANCDKTTLIPKVLPNVTAWNGISIGNMFTVLLNMEKNNVYGWGTSGDNIDTHMIKNVEWGAVTYLSKSVYGKNTEEVYINNNTTYGTGCAGGAAYSSGTPGCANAYNTAGGVKASTSGTIYGIYDMSGGAIEYVAAYIDNNNSNLTTYGSSLVSANLKYKDVYGKSVTDTVTDNYALLTNIKGDALWEISSSSTTTSKTSWFSDASIFSYGSVPFIFRGGGPNNSGDAGIFYFNGTGGLSTGTSSRPVLLVDKGL